jgi:hypothetical protein
MSYFRCPRHAWPAVVDALTRPWLDEWVEMDCAYWAGEVERHLLGYRNDLPRRGRRITTRFCAERWGWSERQTRKALRRYDPMAAKRSESDRETIEKRSSNQREEVDNSEKAVDFRSESDRETIYARVPNRPQTHTTDVTPPYPPEGGMDPALVSAVRQAMADDPMGWSDERWIDEHHNRDLYHIASDDVAADIREGMLADRPTEPMSPTQVLATMWRQGWRGSGRGGRPTKADRRHIEALTSHPQDITMNGHHS